jgi:hypothetical protein
MRVSSSFDSNRPSLRELRADLKLISPASPVERGGEEAPDLFLCIIVVDPSPLPVFGALCPAVEAQIDAAGSDR